MKVSDIKRISARLAIAAVAAFLAFTAPARADPIFTPFFLAVLTSSAIGLSPGVAAIAAPALAAIVTPSVGKGMTELKVKP